MEQTPLAVVARLAPFAALSVGPPLPGWRPAAGLLADPTDLVSAVATALGGCEPRVAASTVGLGWSGRLWSIGLTLHAGWGLVPDLDRLRWRHDEGRVRLRLPAQAVRPGGAEALFAAVVDGQLRPLFANLTPLVAEGALWGNAASSIVAAGGQVRPAAGPAGTAAALAATAYAVDALLARAPLAGRLDAAGRRRSCCLFYRVPGGGLCGDCSLDAVPVRG
ncbi:MAG: iron reductase [Frankiales bacterium]|nr:iron reductase [Frankiales bacterium]